MSEQDQNACKHLLANVKQMRYSVLVREDNTMALKTANFNMRLEEKKKADAEALYRALGMTLPQAVNMFISQSLLVGGLPFDVKLPSFSAETEAAINEARDIMSGKKNVKAYNSVSELFEELESK